MANRFFDRPPRRITLFSGHYGSGKTNLAVNYALWLKGEGKEVTIADLDIVNPYFRTKDSAAELAAANVPLISPAFANTNVDLPALPQEIYALVMRKDRYAVMDIGGDDRGAYALGRYAPYILEEGDYEHLFVVNFYRPLTRTAQEALTVMKEIEDACHIPFTAIVNNSNVGEETQIEDVQKTAQEAETLAALCGLPIIGTSVKADLASALKGDAIPLHLQKKYF